MKINFNYVQRQAGVTGCLLPPCQGSAGWGRHLGFHRSGSTPGYIPVAASRLRLFAIHRL